MSESIIDSYVLEAFDLELAEEASSKKRPTKLPSSGEMMINIIIGTLVLPVAIFALPIILFGAVGPGIFKAATDLDKACDTFRKNKKYVKQNYTAVKLPSRVNHCNEMQWSDKVPQEKQREVIKVLNGSLIQNALKDAATYTVKSIKADYYEDLKYKVTKLRIKCPGISLIEVSTITMDKKRYGHTQVKIEFGNYVLEGPGDQRESGHCRIVYDLDTNEIIEKVQVTPHLDHRIP